MRKVADPAPVLARLAGLRQRLDELAQLTTEAERAPIAASEIPARIESVVAALRARAFDGFNSGWLVGHVADDLVQTLADARSPMATLALIAPDVLTKGLTDLAHGGLKAAPPPLSAAERGKRHASLADERRKLEVEETELLWALEDGNHVAPWRPDQDPVLVLGLGE